jgi:beta-lactamase class A
MTSHAMNASRLRQQLVELERRHDGEYSLAVVDLQRDAAFDWRGDQVRPTASVCKLFILCELFRQAQERRIDLHQPITWDARHLRRGDGVLRAFRLGDALSAYNLAVLMMIVSDNVATARLLELVGAANVNATLRQWGLGDSDLFQGLPHGPDAAAMKQPQSTAADLCGLMVRLYRRQLLEPGLCDDIIAIMRAQRVNDMLPRYLPVGEDWGDSRHWIASKTGYGHCRVEVGIVHGPEARFALAMFFQPRLAPRWNSKCLADYPPVLAMAQACRAVYAAVGSTC